jgi:AcrR family transcriptional regulator
MEYIGGYTSIDFLKRCAGYEAAKEQGDISAADAIVKKCVGTEKLQYIRKKYPDSFLLPVITHHNVLPLALCINIGLPISLTVQGFTPRRRTNLSAIERILCRPIFAGDITPGKNYILVDDVITQGATVAALIHFVTQNGGKVCAVTTLAYARGSRRIVPSKEIRDKLKQRFGKKIIRLFEEYGLGKDVLKQLSNAEMLYLLKFSDVESIRKKIDVDSYDLPLTSNNEINKKTKIGMQTDKLTARDKILYAAIRLFTERGYSQVSMNILAKTVGYKMATVYKYFNTKKELLTSIYDFYSEQRKIRTPDVNNLLTIANILDLQSVLKKLVYDIPPELEDTMNRIRAIATHALCINNESEKFIKENLLEPTIDILTPLLNTLIESNKIEPINIESFVDLFIGFDYYATTLNHSALQLGFERWVRGRELILSLLNPKQINAAPF